MIKKNTTPFYYACRMRNKTHHNHQTKKAVLTNTAFKNNYVKKSKYENIQH